MNFENIIQIEDYNYDLPNEKIAKFPLNQRDKSKLLIYKNQEISESIFDKIDEIIPENSLLFFNNTKVIQARIYFFKSTGAKIEIFCLEPIHPSGFIESFSQTESCVWKCIIGNLKKWKDKSLQKTFTYKSKEIILEAEIVENFSTYQYIKFSWNDNSVSFSEILSVVGVMPIPPYLNRESVDNDKNTYQTVYSKINGSVAAPTAGLHFTDAVFSKLENKKIKTAEITLHVGAGTFKPVTSENAYEHEMHAEHFWVDLNTLKLLLKNLDSIIAVGTTSLRTLESIYWLGVKVLKNKDLPSLHIQQWEYKSLTETIPVTDAITCLINYLEKNNRTFFEASTQIMIVPGYEFKIVKGIITNFHQPKSTLLLLIAAFIGKNWQKLYEYALQNHFRFLSYGDSSILLKNA